MFTLDIGGEGRHPEAWNLNISRLQTLGPEKGLPIRRWIFGRSTCLPFADGTVDRIIMEKTPLTRVAIGEMVRVLKPGGEIVLRHFHGGGEHPHGWARKMIRGQVSIGRARLRNQWVEETVIRSVESIEQT